MKKSSANQSIPVLMAVGGSLATFPAAALELGDVKVDSSLGQPLRASIAYALGPHESLNSTCVTVQSSSVAAGIPTVNGGSVAVGNGVITIASKTIARDPLMTMRVNIRCPYTARLSREYVLFVDPAQPLANATVEPAAAAATVPRATTRRRPAAVSRRPTSQEPIGNATRYLVQSGDSLSQIAQRIQDRPVGLWEAVTAIFDANPDAFLDNDINQLQAGSWLDIPDFGAAGPVTVADSPVPAEPFDEFPELPPVEAREPTLLTTLAEESISPLADLQPGDVILESDIPFVSADDNSIVIPDTIIDTPAATSSSPNVPVATIRPAGSETSPSNWLWWLVGSGVAIIATLLFLSARIRDRFGSTPIGATTVKPQRRKTDIGTQRMATIGDATIEVEEIISDDSPTEENLALDADLEIGTGLTESTDVDVSQDFGFAATTELDIELPEDMSSGKGEPPETDVIPPLNVDVESILESEVLPEDEVGEEDDYDMSVIVDATKMPNPDDVTERDLEAIPVDIDNEPLIDDDYTVSKEVDYKILEQDYEDEMTATQALNQEIEKVANELANDLSASMDATADLTEISHASSVTSLDITAQMPANDDVQDDDATAELPSKKDSRSA